MEDAGRFVRFVMPGFVFGVEVFLCLLVVFPCWTYEKLSDFANNDNLSIAIGSILASGVLGYIFATVHHWWHWSCDKGILDHSPLIERLSQNGLICVEKNIDRKRALIISMALWYERVAEGGLIGVEADNRLKSLGHYVHGLGTVRVASFFALVTALIICSIVGEFRPDCVSILRFTGMIEIPLGVMYMFNEVYSRVGETTQGIYNEILENALAKEWGQAE